MQTTFILVRHGKSEAAEKGIVQGQGLAVPLIDIGKKQAQAVAQMIRDMQFDRIFVSQARRARETAEFIRVFYPTLQCDTVSELNERSKGIAEGMKKEEFDKLYPDILAQWSQNIDARPDGGENFEDVERRVWPIFERHAKEYAGKTLLYVGHGNVFRVILGRLQGVPFGLRGHIKQDYCCVNSIVHSADSGIWKIEYANRVSL